MLARIKQRIKRALVWSGHYTRRLRRDSFPGVLVLCYHGVRADDWPNGRMMFEELHVRVRELESHCRLFTEHCHPISLERWREAMNGGPPLPARPVLMTFDDGYRSILTRGLPILQRYHVPAVVFVCTEPIERQELFWHDAVARAQGPEEVQRMKRLPFVEWDTVRRKWACPAREGAPDAPLAVADVQALAASPLIEIGGHTTAHPVLALADRDDQLRQIVSNRDCLERWTGRPVRTCAYPDGLPGLDYTAETVDVMRAAGIEMAFTTRQGFAAPADLPLERSRFVMLTNVGSAELLHRLCFSWRH